ncbi:hypothetical protein [Prosthecomicrobium sp. N25]|uniref:hypothetical protein n=1 Tax=Prosthecomicrobium sp. N25 TaxID=3129254 RepID=UPI003077F368
MELFNWRGAEPVIETDSDVVRISNISHNKQKHVTRFTIQARGMATGVARIINSASNDPTFLTITVGIVLNHTGMKYDLIAELGRSTDLFRLDVYRRILAKQNNQNSETDSKGDQLINDWHNWDRVLKDQPLKQITDPDHPKRWNCGASLNQFGHDYFGDHHFMTEQNYYYTPIKGATINKQAIPLDKEVADRGRQRIKEKLAKGTAVRVFVGHNDPMAVAGGRIKANGNTHYLTIVGCNEDATLFLVTDPWPYGNIVDYHSGLYGTVECDFMGQLSWDDRWGFLHTDDKTRGRHTGTHNYWVLMGP